MRCKDYNLRVAPGLGGREGVEVKFREKQGVILQNNVKINVDQAESTIKNNMFFGKHSRCAKVGLMVNL